MDFRSLANICYRFYDTKRLDWAKIGQKWDFAEYRHDTQQNPPFWPILTQSNHFKSSKRLHILANDPKVTESPPVPGRVDHRKSDIIPPGEPSSGFGTPS